MATFLDFGVTAINLFVRPIDSAGLFDCTGCSVMTVVLWASFLAFTDKGKVTNWNYGLLVTMVVLVVGFVAVSEGLNSIVSNA